MTQATDVAASSEKPTLLGNFDFRRSTMMHYFDALVVATSNMDSVCNGDRMTGWVDDGNDILNGTVWRDGEAVKDFKIRLTPDMLYSDLCEHVWMIDNHELDKSFVLLREKDDLATAMNSIYHKYDDAVDNVDDSIW